MLKKISIFIIIIVLLLSVSSCSNDKYANVFFDELEYSVDVLEKWSAEIKYIGETRGSTDVIYSKIKYDEENPLELFRLIEIFYGAKITEAPNDFIFSAEAMSDYVFEFYKEDIELPVLSFYYDQSGDLLTRVERRVDEKDGKEYIDYKFYTPNGDLLSIATEYRLSARIPSKKTAGISLNQKQLIASVQKEELEERMQYSNDEYEQAEGIQEGEINFEIYSDSLPFDEGTTSKLYDVDDIPTLSDDQVVIMARIAGTTGEPQDLIINFLEFNTYYTIVLVSYPNEELQAELGITTQNAILVNIDDIDPNKYIVFVDDEGEVVNVVVPFIR